MALRILEFLNILNCYGRTGNSFHMVLGIQLHANKIKGVSYTTYVYIEELCHILSDIHKFETVQENRMRELYCMRELNILSLNEIVLCIN